MNNIQEKLIFAIRNSNLGLINELINEGVDINFRIKDSGLTPLLVAAGIGNPECIRLLIQNGADIFVVDTKAGTSALHKACQSGNLESVRILVEAGAFIDWVAATTGHTPLLEAQWFVYPDIVEYLLQMGAGLNLPTHYGFSIEQHLNFQLNVNVAKRDKLLKCKELIDNKIKNDNDTIKNLHLINAVINNDIKLAEKLINSGYNLEERYPLSNSFNDFHTPLLIASRDGMYEISKLLVEAGANVNAIEPTFGAVPLHKSIYNNHYEITKLLIEANGTDLNFQGYTNGYTPLHDALWHSNAECAELLINAGVNTNLYGHDSKLPYDIALMNLGENHKVTLQLRELTNLN